MKTVIAFALFIAGLSAAAVELKEADLRQPRIVTNAIESAIDDLRHLIRDNGLDPLDIEKEDVAFNPDLPVDVSLNGWVEGLLVVGLSDIRINNLHFGVLSTRLTFDLEMPLISISMKDGAGVAGLFENKYTLAGHGYGDIKRMRVTGSVRVSVGVLSGITIRDLIIDFLFGSVEANVQKFIFQGEDKTAELNKIFNHHIPDAFEKYSSEINAILEAIVLAIADEML